MSAELQERQKQVREAEAKVMGIKQNLSQVYQKADACNSTGRKAQLMEQELKIVPEDRKVYKAIGKTFIERPCADLVKEVQDKQQVMISEVEKCIASQKTLSKAHEEAEADFKRLFNQFVSEAKLLQASQQKK
ncbi:hypothetical protein DIPPA_15179 [Diplonema papillatum]|nr:hypothetical protein DIPPA_15179 [Diplonema papillatum]